MTKPHWIRTKLSDGDTSVTVYNTLTKLNVHTVCKEARCPNIGECFSRNHATFMILGDVCTRSCRFCNVKKGMPLPPDLSDIENIAKAVETLKQDYVVITSVTRDDLTDGGSEVFAKLIIRLKKMNPLIKIEILTPDFLGIAYDTIIESKPYIWAHNMETVPRLYEKIRPLADYKRSLKLLEKIKSKTDDILTKSGIMLGLGEKKEEIFSVLEDLKAVGVCIVTLGQYLQPSKNNIEVARYLKPEEFEFYKIEALNMGFKSVLSGPLIRSSYRKEDSR